MNVDKLISKSHNKKFIFKRFNDLFAEDITFDLHMHTNQTDGLNSIDEMIAAAEKLNLKTIAFTEHVNLKNNWFLDFKEQVQKAKVGKGIDVFTGIEAKALDFEGNIDASEEIISNAELVIGSVHRYPDGHGGLIDLNDLPNLGEEKVAELEFKLAMGILKNKNVDILGHPFGVYSKFFTNFPENYLRSLMIESIKRNKAIEISTKYNISTGKMLSLLKEINPFVSIGSDAHKTVDIFKDFNKIIDVIKQKEINILVTSAGSAISQGIIKSIKMSNLKVRIITTDVTPFAAGLYRGNVGYLVPYAKQEKEYIESIIDICKKENISGILIGLDYELQVLSKNKSKIEKETSAKVIVSNPGIIKISNDKWLTYKFLLENNLPAIPSTLHHNINEFIANEGFPLIIKPRIGDSSKNTFIVRTKEELDEKLNILMNSVKSNPWLSEEVYPIIQKYMGTEDEEFTSSTVVFDKKCYGVVSMKRQMRFGGHTTRAEINDYLDINQYIKSVAEKLDSFGPCNFQSRVINGIPYIFEINCRFSGTISSCAIAGFNSVEACIRKILLNESIKELTHKNGVMLRYFNEVFIPFSEIETITREGNIKNPQSEVNNSF
ncbi:MAG: PHP domain-containing protein [Nanoarchaeota archaeon]